MYVCEIGGGLVIGLSAEFLAPSAGFLAPVIGAGLGAVLTTVGVIGATGFLAGAGGAAIITGGVLTGSSIAGIVSSKIFSTNSRIGCRLVARCTLLEHPIHEANPGTA
ncbi:hypothetical protein FRC12_015919 [Ceratobasidium sp. 428]|nr:hypothetical protein FRC12_015919 [Ceratobasidium sp. 428]